MISRTRGLLLALMLTTACEVITPTPPPPIIQGKRVRSLPRPTNLFTHTIIDLTDKAKRLATVHADTLVQYVGDERVHLRAVHLDFYDSLGAISSTLDAPEGQLRERTQEFVARGGTRWHSSDGLTLDTDSLRWSPDAQLVTTGCFVTITRGREQVRGDGFRATLNFTRLEILKNVSGRVQLLDR